MKRFEIVLITALFTTVILLLVFVSLLLTGVVNINLKNNDNVGDDNNIKEEVVDDNFNNNDNNGKQGVFVISYKDDVFQKNIGKGTLKNTRNLPVIKNSVNQNAADKIVDYLTNVSNKDWNNANEYYDEVVGLGENYTIGVSYLFSTLVNNDKVISIAYNLNGSMGGVSWIGNWGYNFDPDTGSVLNFSDVVVNSVYDDLYNYIISEIENKYEADRLWQKDSTSDYWKDSVKKYMFDLGNWFFTDKGISITFDKYLLGPGASGVISVDIPKDKINNYLKDEYKM